MKHTVDAFKTLLPKLTSLRVILAIVVLLGTMTTLYTRHDSLEKSPVEDEFSGKVIRVIDGDTVKLLTGSNELRRVRLAFIDSPEIGQAYGQSARKNLVRLIEGQTVRIKLKNNDQYGRAVAQVCLNQQDINLIQIQDGYAWHYQYYAKKKQSPEDFYRYAQAEQVASKMHLGLWKEKHPTPPWRYRASRKQASSTGQ